MTFDKCPCYLYRRYVHGVAYVDWRLSLTQINCIIANSFFIAVLNFQANFVYCNALNKGLDAYLIF